MDSFELNKILGAVLGTLLFVMGVGFLAEGIYHPIEDRGPGYALPEPEPVSGEGEEAVEVAVVDIGTLMASADAEEGQGQARKCQSCHSFDEGGPNGQGPNLWGIVGRPVASHEGFAYSEAMIAHAAEAPTWTYEQLSGFLHAPKAWVPGTKMNFAGVPDDEERANIIAFLSTLSSSPVPFPEPAAAPAEGEAPADAAAAGEETAPADTATPAVEVEAPPAEDTAAPPADAPAMAAEPVEPAAQ